MGILLLLLVIIALFVLGSVVVSAALHVLWFLLVGLVIGALARLVIPGRQQMGWLLTALIGGVGALVGGIIADRVLDAGSAVSLLVSVVVAAVLVALFSAGDRDRSRAL
jgi:uncharacterized membrane protein YeaQ/YmgE (transglycosylase-associated protein family)